MSFVQTGPNVNEERTQRLFDQVADFRKAAAADELAKLGTEKSPEVKARLEKISV